MNKIYILGIGPGHRDYLLKITEDIIDSSDVLIGGSRALQMFAELDKKMIKITADLEKIKNYILANYQNESISVLVSGDPGLYSMMYYLKKYLDKEQMEVIPGISSLQLAAARSKLSWNDMKITSLHGNDDSEKIVREIKDNKKVGLFTDSKYTPDKIAELLLNNDIKKRKAIVFERLSYPDEKITAGSLKEIKENKFGKLTVMVIYDEEVEI